MKRRRPASASGTIDMRVAQLTIDPMTRLPLVILKDERGDEALPIWIGLIEANAIATELEQIELERPVAHDLMKDILGAAGLTLESIEVDDVKENTFYASIYLSRGARSRRIKVDSRPSDAIALALRCDAPIRVRRRVLERARRVDLGAKPVACETEGAEALALAELLAGMPDEDFGKWKM
jgi:bifunctional DNase/RNase